MERALTSSLSGPFDPRDARDIDGRFAFTLADHPLAIDAPASCVCQIMVDFARSPEWNPLNRFFELDTQPAVNAKITLGYNFRACAVDEHLPAHDGTRRERITVWEPEACFAYADVGLGRRNERTQYLHADGAERCLYYNYERFSGALAPVIRALYGESILAAFR